MFVALEVYFCVLFTFEAIRLSEFYYCILHYIFSSRLNVLSNVCQQIDAVYDEFEVVLIHLELGLSVYFDLQV